MSHQHCLPGRRSSWVRAVAFVGAGLGLGACTAGGGSGSLFGGSGGTGGSISMGATGGIPIGPRPVGSGGSAAVGPNGGTTCVNGQPSSATPRLMGGGLMPTLPATITKATSPLPPISGGTLVVLASGSAAVASDPDRDKIYVVDLLSNVVSTVALQPGDEPGRLLEDGAGRVHVALRRGGAVVSLDPKTATLGERRPVCSAPRGIAYDAASKVLHVACAGGELVSLPAAGGPASRQLRLENDLRDVVVRSDGSLLISTFRKAEVLVVDAGGTITSRLSPGSGPVPTILGTSQVRTPSVAWRMVARGDGQDSVVMLHQTGVTDTIDPAAGGYAGLKGCGGIVQSGVSILTPGQASPPVSGGLSDVALAVDVAMSPDKTKIAVAVPGNSLTQGLPTIVEGRTTTMTQGTSSPCSTRGDGLTNLPPTGEVVAVAYSPTGVLFAQTREPAVLWREDTGATVSLSTETRVDTGHDVFHVNAGGGLACASCHPEGGEDGRVWNFVCLGGRRTQSIRGGILATAPFHWDGAESDIGRLMDDVFSSRMAGPMLSDAQKSALAGWIDTIPAMPALAGLDAAAVSRGRALFNDAAVGCTTCHTGALLTNNQTVDVGTGQMLQVPSLRGVAWRAPFMHDGCATSLAERFGNASCGGGDKHGLTSTLTATQTADLTAYLQSL